jgi:hypothetical protein
VHQTFGLLSLGLNLKETTREKKIGTCKAQFEVDPSYSRAGQHAEAGQPVKGLSKFEEKIIPVPS